MDYIILKNIGFRQYRVYVENKEVEGDVVYTGHKLGVNPNLISHLIDYRSVAKTNKVLVLKYDKVIDSKVNIHDKTSWDSGTLDSFDKLIWNSWISLLTALEKRNGNFRKISITRVNI